MQVAFHRFKLLVLLALVQLQLHSVMSFSVLPSCYSCLSRETSSFEEFRKQASLARRQHTFLWASASPYLSAQGIYFDVAIQGQSLGRLEFALSIPSPLPAHAQNLIDLCEAHHYIGSEFDYGADYIEGESRYRWCHILRGRPVKKIIADPESQRNSKHSLFGGNYYGDVYEGQSVVLSVAIEGPGRGSARFSIVRIAESPQEWGERLLLNSGVIGELVSGLDTLQRMARQTKGPPSITACGVVKHS